MKKKYPIKNLLILSVSLLILTVVSCKKNPANKGTTTTIVNATPTTLGLYEADSSVYKELITVVSKIGTQNVNYDLVFDTGSGGMVLDASGILPASMITNSGFNFTGDSTVVNGITITNQTNTVEYGADANTYDKVYGNLAYAAVTIGDQNGNIVVKRLPFFIYYKAVSSKGAQYPAHDFDTFGVSEEYDITFPNGNYITSPFAAYDPGTGLKRGFKMAQLNASNFSLNGSYVPGALTMGLTSDDLNSSGFTMSQLTYYAGDGYAPIIPGTITYNNRASFRTNLIFDTGTEPFNYLEDPTYTGSSLELLPASSPVAVSATSGFNYSFTTTPNDYLTEIENANTSGTTVSIISLEFFLTNEYMLDFTDHKLGLKNN
jgi:hypothetical protein